MGKYFDMLMEDVRMKEGLHSCMNCGVCTGVCPAAEFYNYDPRQIVSIVQTRDDEAIERLLKSDTIWYCGECMSCRPRCPRGNTPGYVIQALRTLSQKLGFFVESEKGRQQLALKRIIGENILRTGYCIVPRLVKPDLHPEQGTVWKWIYDNDREIYGQFTPVYMRHGAGALRRLDEESLAEINEIFKVSGGSEMFDTIERHSDRKAREMGYEEGADQQYMMDGRTTRRRSPTTTIITRAAASGRISSRAARSCLSTCCATTWARTSRTTPSTRRARGSATIRTSCRWRRL